MPRAALLLGVLAAASAAQTFHDEDFDFRFDPPAGMRRLSDAERARAAFNLLAPDNPDLTFEAMLERVRNEPRAESASGRVLHRHVWVEEATPYARQVELVLQDGELPFSTPQQFVAQYTQQGLTIESQDTLRGPPLGPGMRLEGTWTGAGGLELRKRVLVMIDPGGERWGRLEMQAYDSDWHVVGPEFDGVETTIDWPRTMGGLGPGARAAVGASDAGDPGDWGTPEVLGSLILAVLVLGHLVLSRS